MFHWKIGHFHFWNQQVACVPCSMFKWKNRAFMVQKQLWACARHQLSICTLNTYISAYTRFSCAYACFQLSMRVLQLSTCTLPVEHIHVYLWNLEIRKLCIFIYIYMLIFLTFQFFLYSLDVPIYMMCDFAHISVQKCISATFWPLHFPAWSKYHFRTKFVERFIEKLDIFIFETSRLPVCPKVCSSEKIVHLWCKSIFFESNFFPAIVSICTPPVEHMHA